MADIRRTPLLVNFNDYAPEDPVSMDGQFAHLPIYPLSLRSVDTNGADALADALDSQPHPTSLAGYIAFSYYTRIIVDGSGDWEVWGCMTGGQLGAALETWRLAVWESPDGGSGYLAYYGGGIDKNFTLRNYSGGWLNNLNFTDVAGGSGGYPNLMLMRRVGSVIELWASYDDGSNWVLTCSTGAGAHDSSLYLSLGVEDPTNGGLDWTCFGGGVPNRTQIYRWLPGNAEGKVGLNTRYADRRAHGIGRGLLNEGE